MERSRLRRQGTGGSGLRRTCLISPILASALLANCFVLFLTSNTEFMFLSFVWAKVCGETAAVLKAQGSSLQTLTEAQQTALLGCS